MMKRAKNIEERSQKTVEEKSKLAEIAEQQQKEKIEDIKKTGFTDVSQTLKSRTSLSENIDKAYREKQKAEQNNS